MNVEELIEYLKQFPQDFTVQIWNENLQQEVDLEKENIYVNVLHKEVTIA